MIKTVKIFKNGASQAVRLPKDIHFDDDEVCLVRVGHAVMIYPKGRKAELMEYEAAHPDGELLRGPTKSRRLAKQGGA